MYKAKIKESDVEDVHALYQITDTDGEDDEDIDTE